MGNFRFIGDDFVCSRMSYIDSKGMEMDYMLGFLILNFPISYGIGFLIVKWQSANNFS